MPSNVSEVHAVYSSDRCNEQIVLLEITHCERRVFVGGLPTISEMSYVNTHPTIAQSYHRASSVLSHKNRELVLNQSTAITPAVLILY